MISLRPPRRSRPLPVARWILTVALAMVSGTSAETTLQAERLKVWFFGDSGKTSAAARMADITTRMLDRNIEIYYSEDRDLLLSPTLPGYHAILVYGDHPELPAAHEAALADYVGSGGGLLSVHTGGGNFPKSAAWAGMIGTRAEPAGEAAEITTSITAPDHPLMRDHRAFTTWDVPVTHRDQHGEDRTVLATYTVPGGGREPAAWVRTHGKGRVFYTALGHDHRTWINEGFIDLIERAIRWTGGQEVPAAMTTRQLHRPFEFVEAKVPYRRPNEREHPDHPDIPKTWPTKQLPLSPAESMRRMVTPAGFEVRLFASEPDIRKAIAMAWDERGRLFVAETLDYPNQLREEGGRDRITICEDTTGDGKADKFTVFAEHLNIPTSLTFARGGLIVHQAPHTLFLKDTTGDDKADVREVMFTGWGLRDTHAGPNNLNYGLDNWIWGAVGYSNFKGTLGGETHEFGNGFYRFKPDGSKMEWIAQGHRNVYGFGVSEEGDLFGTGANGAPSMTLPLPNRFFELAGATQGSPTHTYRTARGLPIFRRFRQNDGYGIYSAGTGHYLYTARNYPQEYWNRIAFVNEPTLGLVGQWVLEKDGCAYKGVNHSNLVASDDEYFSPIVSRVGPDGAVWVLDWYNYIIQHNPTPPGHKHGIANAFESEVRDQEHGRIYRIVHTGGTPDAAPPLHQATPAQLAAALAHPNQFWRTHAQRLLVERADHDVVPRLVSMLNDPSVDRLGLNVGALHAARTMSGLGALDDPSSEAFAAVANALRHPSPGVRSNAAKSLPESDVSVRALVTSGILNDREIKVRLAAFEALAGQPASEAAGAAVFDSMAKSLGDRWLRVAATAAAKRHAGGFLARSKEQSPTGPMRDIVAGIRPSAAAETADPDAADRVHLKVGMILNQMKFDTATLVVKAGRNVRLTFTNNDLLEHNLVIVKPGTLRKVGELADHMITAPGASEKHYVPDTPDVLWATRILDPDESQDLLFTAPSVPGDYPFVCTFPGHWQLMHGILRVEPAE